MYRTKNVVFIFPLSKMFIAVQVKINQWLIKKKKWKLIAPPPQLTASLSEYHKIIQKNTWGAG